jgi:hypothetical protein
LVTLTTFYADCKSWSPSLCDFLQSPVTASVLGIFVSTQLSIGLALCYFLGTRDRVSHPYWTVNLQFFSV